MRRRKESLVLRPSLVPVVGQTTTMLISRPPHTFSTPSIFMKPCEVSYFCLSTKSVQCCLKINLVQKQNWKLKIIWRGLNWLTLFIRSCVLLNKQGLLQKTCSLHTIVSCPDPTCEERVWWHPADPLVYTSEAGGCPTDCHMVVRTVATHYTVAKACTIPRNSGDETTRRDTQSILCVG